MQLLISSRSSRMRTRVARRSGSSSGIVAATFGQSSGDKSASRLSAVAKRRETAAPRTRGRDQLRDPDVVCRDLPFLGRCVRLDSTAQAEHLSAQIRLFLEKVIHALSPKNLRGFALRQPHQIHREPRQIVGTTIRRPLHQNEGLTVRSGLCFFEWIQRVATSTGLSCGPARRVSFPLQTDEPRSAAGTHRKRAWVATSEHSTRFRIPHPQSAPLPGQEDCMR